MNSPSHFRWTELRRAGCVGAALAIAGLALAAALFVGERLIAPLVARLPALRAETELAALALIGALVYGGALALLFGPEWLAAFRRRRGSPPAGAPLTPPADADAPPV